VRERVAFGGSHGSPKCINTHTRQRPAVAVREVVCGDGHDATRPGDQHLSAWHVRALRQVAATTAATDGARVVAAARGSRQWQQSCSERARERERKRLTSGPY
jgi:hypothetical protein